MTQNLDFSRHQNMDFSGPQDLFFLIYDSFISFINIWITDCPPISEELLVLKTGIFKV